MPTRYLAFGWQSCNYCQNYSKGRRSTTVQTWLSKQALGGASGWQGLLQEAPGQSPCLVEPPLWALVGWGRHVGAWGAGLGVVGGCWSAVVCSPADAAIQIGLVMA